MARSRRPRPLTQREQDLMQALARALLALPRAFDQDLLREQDMSATEYFTLMHLSEAPGRRLRMSKVASATALTLSGATRVIKRLEAQGFVRREQGADDARVQEAVLTDAGLARLEAAWPDHIASVRRHVFDRLQPGEVEALIAALNRLAPETGAC